MRLPPIPTASLTPEQKSLYSDMRDGIQQNFKGFTAINDTGQLIGPWNPWLSFPKFGGPMWELVKALSISPTLPRPVREVAILVTGAKFHSAYELYAHVLAAELRGLPDEKISTIVAGQRPGDLTEEEAIAYDVASNLVAGGVLPTLTYQRAVGAFGEEGAAELIYLVGLFLLDRMDYFKVPVVDPQTGAIEKAGTSWFTGIHPFLALQAILASPNRCMERAASQTSSVPARLSKRTAKSPGAPDGRPQASTLTRPSMMRCLTPFATPNRTMRRSMARTAP